MSTSHRLMPAVVALGVACAFGLSGADDVRPPGDRPLESSVPALTGGRIVISPGKELEKGNIILRDGRITAVGANAAIPPEARVHDMTGTTIYAGFIDAHVSFSKSSAGRETGGKDEGPPIADALDLELRSGAGGGFLGVSSAAGEPGTKSVVTPERRMAREHAPEKKSLDALRAEGFTAANVAPDSGVIR